MSVFQTLYSKFCWSLRTIGQSFFMTQLENVCSGSTRAWALWCHMPLILPTKYILLQWVHGSLIKCAPHCSFYGKFWRFSLNKNTPQVMYKNDIRFSIVKYFFLNFELSKVCDPLFHFTFPYLKVLFNFQMSPVYQITLILTHKLVSLLQRFVQDFLQKVV